MEAPIKQIKKPTSSLNSLQQLLIQEFFSDMDQSLSSKELDYQFDKDLRLFTKVFDKLSNAEKQSFVELYLSRVVETFIDQKVDKELEFSLKKILKL